MKGISVSLTFFRANFPNKWQKWTKCQVFNPTCAWAGFFSSVLDQQLHIYGLLEPSQCHTEKYIFLSWFSILLYLRENRK